MVINSRVFSTKAVLFVNANVTFSLFLLRRRKREETVFVMHFFLCGCYRFSLFFFVFSFCCVCIYVSVCVDDRVGGLANNERREEEPEKPCKMPIKIKTGNIINEIEGGDGKVEEEFQFSFGNQHGQQFSILKCLDCGGSFYFYLTMNFHFFSFLTSRR